MPLPILGSLLALVLMLVSTNALATGWHHLPMVHPPGVTPLPVTPPPTVAPPAASQPAQAGTAKGAGMVGWYAMGFVLVFYYLSICQLEEERDPEMFKTLMCPETPDWKVAPPFTTGP